MDELIANARQASAAASARPGDPALAPSAHWRQVLARFHARAFAQCRDSRELIAFATENNGFVIYRLNDAPEAGLVADRYLAWLARQGQPLETWPESVAESPFASPRVVLERGGRRASTSLLWHLCAAARLGANIRPPRTILEIGPGFGGFARIMKLCFPAAAFALVDLPESLVFADVYLRLHFPDKKVLFVTDPSAIRPDWDAAYDFILVPSNLLNCLRGLSVDLAVNVASLGEMTLAATAAYLRFLERDMKVAALYSVNQYGRFPAESAARRGKRLRGEDICQVSLPADSRWRTVAWHYLEEDGFVQADPLMAPCLEVLLTRPPAETWSEADDAALAARLTAEAQGHPPGSAEWHRRLWDVHRLAPQAPGAALLAAWGRALDYPEF